VPHETLLPPAAPGATRDLRRAIELVAGVAVPLLPLAILHARALADILVCAVDLLFLVRSALDAEWSWTRRPWVRLAAGLWVWLIACTLLRGDPPAIGQAAVSGRLFLFVAACEHWALAEARTRRLLGLAYAAAAAWVAIESWQQFLLGRNLFGFPRNADGALTGPFRKPRAGMAYLGAFFPGVLPAALRLGRVWATFLLLGAAAATQVLIGQRMPTLLTVFGLLVAALLLPRLRLPVLAALALAALVVAATPLVSPPTFAKLVLHFAEQMRHFWVTDYGQIFVRALAMVEASPWTGLGMDGFRDHCLDAAYLHGAAWLGLPDSAVLATNGCNIHPHNYWLEFATSGGLPALAGFAALVGLWLRALARGLMPATMPERTALLVAVVTLLWPFASTSSLFVVDVGGWVFLAVGWGLAEARAAAR
jgi:O-antigen ligase